MIAKFIQETRHVELFAVQCDRVPFEYSEEIDAHVQRVYYYKVGDRGVICGREGVLHDFDEAG